MEALRSELGVHGAGAGAGGPGDGGGAPPSLGDFGAAPGTQDELAAEAVSAADLNSGGWLAGSNSQSQRGS
eukprot:COSAG01_NODE_783_length_13630_cov_5.556459_10_plen_71_part_00